MKKNVFILAATIVAVFTMFACQNNNGKLEQTNYHRDSFLSSSDEFRKPKNKALPEPAKDIKYFAKKVVPNDDSVLQKKFFNKKVARALKENFKIDNPAVLLKTQASALQTEQVDYGYQWAGVSVGYGMMPRSGNVWKNVYLGDCFTKDRMATLTKAKKLLMYPLISSRKTQTQLYNWARATIDTAWSLKPETAQALDMFAIWKTCQYLADYDSTKEITRANKWKYRDVSAGGPVYKEKYHNFYLNDWRGKEDCDAKLYSFWHRRICEYNKTGHGFSKEDATYWTNRALTEMNGLAKPSTKKILKKWEGLWTKGKITSPYDKEGNLIK